MIQESSVSKCLRTCWVNGWFWDRGAGIPRYPNQFDLVPGSTTFMLILILYLMHRHTTTTKLRHRLTFRIFRIHIFFFPVTWCHSHITWVMGEYKLMGLPRLRSHSHNGSTKKPYSTMSHDETPNCYQSERQRALIHTPMLVLAWICKVFDS
jgi:hypothetical protein